MIHWNTEFDKVDDVFPYFTRLVRSFFPETYNAGSLGDFWHNRSIIRPTNKILPPASNFNGFATVSIASGGFYRPIDNVGGELSDVGTVFPVSLHPSRVGDHRIQQDRRLYSLNLLYAPAADKVFLCGFDTEGPTRPDSPPERIHLFKRPQLAFS